MYTILIQNQKTFESFQKFHPLFLEYLNKEKIGVCRWVESGTSVDTALPELCAMIEEKEKWRAIIVHLEDEECMKKYERDVNNPFDFLINKEKHDCYQESVVPLVRLTHMLGGVPAPEVSYEAYEMLDGQNNSKIIYKPVVSQEKQEMYDKLVQMYEYDGKKPEDIILITIRKVEKTQNKSVVSSWTEFNEIQSSNFWENNHYSSISRFITYDLQKLGKNELEADMFKFWNIVLLLSINTINPNELQAYRLYRANIDISREILNKQIQHFALRLNGEKQYIEQVVQQELNKQLSEKKLLPNYQITIPVLLEDSKTSQLFIDKKIFHLLGQSTNDELLKWNNAKDEVEMKLRSNIKQINRKLDESAERMHGLCSVRESEVLRLNKYQKRELRDELTSLYEYILYMQKDMEIQQDSYKTQLKEKSDIVKNFIKNKLNTRQVKHILFVICTLITISMLPALFYMVIKDVGSLTSLISFGLILIDVVAITILGMLAVQKSTLHDYVTLYNVSLNVALNKINKNKEVYSKFLSSIASHSRGCSYLQILEHKKFVLNNLEESIQNHLRSIDLTMLSLDKWKKAFYLNSQKEYTFVQEDSFDLDIPPINNRIYTFEYGNTYSIPMNASGLTIDSCFEFVQKLEIVREEIYDGNN